MMHPTRTPRPPLPPSPAPPFARLAHRSGFRSAFDVAVRTALHSTVRAGVRAGLLLACMAASLSGPGTLGAQDRPADWNPQEVLATEHYTRPPQAIADAVLAPRYRNVLPSNMDSEGRWFVHEVSDGLVPMERFGRPFHDLGGKFIDFAANRDRTLTVRSNAGLEFISAEDGSVTRVRLPDGTRVSNAKWAPTGDRVAFFGHTPTATYLYVAGTDGRARRLSRRPVLATLYTDFDWSDDGRTIAAVFVPANRPPMPQPPTLPPGPQVKLTENGENMLRVYKSLLATPYDKDLLEWHVTGQVGLVDVNRRRVREVGAPTMVRNLDLSPDGGHILIERMVRPFSYIVPVRQFGSVHEIWDADGTVLATVRTDDVDTGIQGGPRTGGPGFSGSGSVEGPRNMAWRSDGAGLFYLEREPKPEADSTASDAARDSPAAGADEDEEAAPRKDRLVLWAPPFGEEDRSILYEHKGSLGWARFGSDPNVVFAAERKGPRVHEFAIFLDSPQEVHTLARYKADDVYRRPGTLVGVDRRFPRPSRFRRRTAGTGDVLLSADGTAAFYQGTEYNEDPEEVGPKSFIDRVNLTTGEKERIYESSNDGLFERPLAAVDLEGGVLVVSRETPTQVPQAYRREGGELTRLTQNVDYTPDLTHAPRKHFKVERPDGFRFQVNVTLPEGYQEGTPLPAMFWFYPREYTDQEDYDESLYTYNKNAFPSFGTRSIEYLVRLGYAVVEPDAPIVGKAGRMNDNYERDLRNNLAAVIDALDDMGIIDRHRLGIGGHSYGAFSTVNAMVHTPFFKAGIAGDGNYNRTLTPLHFQSERRTLWEAREVYLSMSPFLYADDLTGALLLYHGLHDQNVGTDPIHSPKLFHALNGLGKEAAMYLYPFEDHGPAAKETLLDLWARWTAWLDTHLLESGSATGIRVSPESTSGMR
ncbi:MAG: S9 family peptidase [Gemmatimonadota bacterium]